MKLLSLLACVALIGCASTQATQGVPRFVDVKAAKPFIAVVQIEHRQADAETVRGLCYMQARIAGIRLHNGGPPGCSWQEGGRNIVLCTRPTGFNDRLAMEVCGHEAAHFHEGIDHE
jgi:hypothetical protein